MTSYRQAKAKAENKTAYRQAEAENKTSYRQANPFGAVGHGAGSCAPRAYCLLATHKALAAGPLARSCLRQAPILGAGSIALVRAWITD